MRAVDLDEVAARDERANKMPYSVRDLATSQADVPALVAELRAAREVVKAARPYEEYIPPQDVPPGKHPLADALAAYDQAVSP